jgi:hypothetical protein
VRTTADYRRAVPIRTHEELMPWISRAMSGNQNVLTADDPVVYFSSSGSTGREKHIPITATYMRRIFLPFYYASFASLIQTLPDALDMPNGVLNLWQDPTAPAARTWNGQPHIGPSQVDYRKFGENLAVGPGNEASWSAIPDNLADENPWERSYFKLRLAAERDIRVLIGVNPAMVSGLPYQLLQEWPRLVEDIGKGTLNGRPHTTPNPTRAREIEQYANTFGTVYPYHLWPQLSAIVVWNSALASLYLPRVREMYGPGVQLFPAPIASCEGPAAVPIDRHPSGAPLYLPGCFYEFVSADEPITADSETMLATELEPGRDYHLVLSHIGGLYRCAVTDVVRVLGHIGRAPRIEYAGRNITRSLAGETLTEVAAVRALRDACGDSGAEIRNATFHLASAATDSAGRYQVAIAFTATPSPAFAASLDKRLGEHSDGYRIGRMLGTIDPVDVIPVHPDAFLREWARTIQNGQRPPRVKDRVFLPDDDAWARILSSALSAVAERRPAA